MFTPSTPDCGCKALSSYFDIPTTMDCNLEFKPSKPFPLKLIFVIAFYHSNRNQTGPRDKMT